jgi:hypothetical protein
MAATGGALRRVRDAAERVMGAVFTPKANLIFRGVAVGAPALVGAVLLAWYGWLHSAYATGVGYYVSQSVPFSHQHHVAGLGIDCRYCHTTAETTPFAGLPTTETCMHCHAQIWTGAAVLEPVRTSWRTGQPLRWGRVNNVPDYTYFDHAVHVRNGVGCTTCHGAVDQMPLMTKGATLYMKWCLDCHRNPAPHLRPRDALYDPAWQPPDDGGAQGRALMREYGVDTTNLEHCTACHR